MRLIDADKLYPDCLTKDGKLAISQSQLANAPTVEPLERIGAICNENCGYNPQGTGKWIAGENGCFKCNKCGCEIIYSYIIGNEPDFPKFCCDCGAKMETGARS